MAIIFDIKPQFYSSEELTDLLAVFVITFIFKINYIINNIINFRLSDVV